MIEGTWDFAMGQVAQALGDTVTWRPGTQDETELKAVFGHGFDRIQGGGLRVSSRSPEIMVRASDLPADPEKGHQVLVRDTLFEVATPKADVEAVSWTLVLKLA